MTCTDKTKYFGVQIDSKLHFHTHTHTHTRARAHVDCNSFFQFLRTLGLIRTVTFTSSTLDNVLMLYLTLVGLKLE
jgi:hypothetical protein